jgi:hypothetical protein
VKILSATDETQFSEEVIREVENRFITPNTMVRVLHAVAKFVPPAASLLDAGSAVEAAHAELVK